MTDNSSSLIYERNSEKDSKLISEYAEYVKNLRNAENQDEYIKYTAITLFLNDE
ncbi:9430_t:CDS:2, partial [Diversispora eburnea]